VESLAKRTGKGASLGIEGGEEKRWAKEGGGEGLKDLGGRGGCGEPGIKMRSLKDPI